MNAILNAGRQNRLGRLKRRGLWALSIALLGGGILATTSPEGLPDGLAVSQAQAQSSSIYLPGLLADGRFEKIAQPTRAPQPTDEPTPTDAPAPTEPPTATPDPKPDPVDCPAVHFLDVQADPANTSYPDPELNAFCEDDLLIVESNGIPSFEFRRTTPSDLAAQDYRWEIPLEPTMLSEPEDIPLLGAVAIIADGLPIYGPNEAENLGFGDPYLDQILDFCNGHTAARGDYHYHARANCLWEDMEGNADLVLGYAFDGHPIMAPFACVSDDCSEVEVLQSSWQRTQDVRNAWEAHEYIEGSGDLDRCNGMVGPDGAYRYYATDSFPYLLGCYAGEPRANRTGGGGPPGGGDRPPGPRPTRGPAPTNAPPPTNEPAPTDTPAPTAEPEPTPTPGQEAADPCPAQHFLDVEADPANGNYPDPELNAFCEDDFLIVESNGIPSFEFRRITPNDLVAQDYRWQIPLEPQMLAEPEAISLAGAVAIMVDGLPIFGPNEAETHGYGDPYLDQILDFCNGHTAGRGNYHYHVRANCLWEDMEGETDLVLGYGFDGIPIMAPFVCANDDCSEIEELQSSWERTRDVRNAWEAHEYIEGSGDLDRCNGRVGPDGVYRYYATDSFPYLLGCYAGEPQANGRGGGGGGGGGGRPPGRP